MAFVHPVSLDAGALAARLEGRAGLAWLDADGKAERGRWSFVASDPVDVVRASWGDPAPLEAFRSMTDVDDPNETDPRALSVPRFIGFVAYDAAWSARDGRTHARTPGDVVWFGRYDAVAAFDHARGESFVVADDEAACARFLGRAAELGVNAPARAGTLGSEDPDAHERAIREVLARIAAGDVYQVNVSRRFEAAFEGSSFALFRAMRRASPVPFGLFLDADERVVLGRSMERFLAFEAASRRLETRPIKGTIAAGADRSVAARELVADPKEHAEHAMVVDLMRNDLGRVSVPGSVRVEEAFVVEPYARLSHLVSTIASVVRGGLGLADVLEATFPPGSVTGTPKKRAVELIETLERSARDVYCGAYGYVTRGGSLSLAVAIRTAVVRGGMVRYDAGGGIVSESDPVRETRETELKTCVMRDALEALAGADDGRAPHE